MTSSFRFFLFAAALPLFALAACKDNKSQIAETGIIVEVSSDLLVPDEINQVQLITTDQQGTELLKRTVLLGSGAGRFPLPVREGIYPKHETDRPIHIKVLGLLGTTQVVSNSATVSFEQGKILALPLPLFAVCRPTKCSTYEACKANGKCESDLLPIGALLPYVPNQTLDAGTSGPEVEIAVDAPADAKPDVASDRQPDMASDSAEDAPTSTGTASTTGTGTASASATGTETATATGSGTGPGSGTATVTVTGTGATATSGSTGTAVVVTGTGTTTRTGTGTGAGTGTGNTSTTTVTGTGTGASNTGTGTGTSISRCPDLAANCGPQKDGDCCVSLPVKGGDFYLSYDGVSEGHDPDYPATVSDFYLDKYEITVGRLRKFVEAGKGTQAAPPAEGNGAHPKIDGSGWNGNWKKQLAVDTPALKKRLRCDTASQTWTDMPGENESKPVNCLDWYTAFAFCAWDGGRLPTEAEWNYAASGGAKQRFFPWSDPASSKNNDASYAVYWTNSAQVVGSKSPKGDGVWGQSDLAGNVAEWILDWHWVYANTCRDCANVINNLDGGAVDRVYRGGWFGSQASDLRNVVRGGIDPTSSDIIRGARCARSAP
jgi:formylglycine-generating enzyme